MIPILGTGIPTGVGSLFQTPVVTAIAAAGRFVPGAGVYYIIAVGADVRLQVIDAGGVWNNLTAAGIVPPGCYIMDGSSVGLVNNGVGSENVTTIQLG